MADERFASDILDLAMMEMSEGWFRMTRFGSEVVIVVGIVIVGIVTVIGIDVTGVETEAGVGLVVRISDWILVGAGSLVDPLPTDWGPAWEFFVAGSAEPLLSTTTGAAAVAGTAAELTGAVWAGGGATDALATGCCCTE